jgi:hypothetical protein
MAATTKMGKKRTSSKKSTGWGGRRPGAGRPVGSGTGPSRHARINRVVAMLSNDELKKMRSHAKGLGLPVSTAAYRIIARSLKRL